MSHEAGVPEVLSMGCRLNIVESEAMRRMASAAGHGDSVILNTCAVTAEAARQARQTIRRLARENPQRPIIVTGCAAQIEPQTFAAMPEVSRVIGNDAKLEPETWRQITQDAGATRVLVGDIRRARHAAAPPIDGMAGHTRAFVPVQNGCNHRCTFCVIPFGRGNSRSVPVADVVQQIARLIENGCPEIVLTGVDLTAYGADLPENPGLGGLVSAILRRVPKLGRLRLSSLDCIEADPLLLDLLKGEPRLLAHLHLSLQSGDDLILKRMKRRHARADAIRFCAGLRAARPDYAFGADLIVGFPTESEAMFGQTLKLVEECGLSFLHVFPFSPRPGTPAARMPQLHGRVIGERAERLREAGRMALARHFSRHVGQVRRVLSEQRGMARLDDFSPLRLPDETPAGLIGNVRITGHDGSRLSGEWIA